MKKIGKKIFLISILPFVMVIISLVTLFDNGMIIFPGSDYGIEKYSNVTSDILKFLVEKEKISLSYKLNKEPTIPFAGITIDLFSSGHYLDITRYSYLSIKIKSSASKYLRLLLLCHEEGMTIAQYSQSYRYLESRLALEANKYLYNINIKTFDTPPWWFSKEHITEDDIGKPDLKRLGRIQVQNGLLLSPGKEDNIEIAYIAFKRSYTVLYIITGIIVLVAAAILITVLIFQKGNQTIITYKPVKLESTTDTNTKKLIEHITTHYADPDLSIESIASETGIITSKISNLIKEHSRLTFKQFLNNLRLTEAKRLLIESDSQIIEISFKVGYNSVSHFNRLFKKIEELSPKEYRKLHKK